MTSLHPGVQVLVESMDWVRGALGRVRRGAGGCGRVRRALGRVRAQLLVVHGEEDTITLVSGAREVVARVASRDKQLVVVEGARHHVLLEQPRIQTTVLDWVLARSNN